MMTSIIGSFQKYYNDVLTIIKIFEKENIKVCSPKYSQIIKNDNGFVILSSDNLSYSNEDIQLIALHRILRSNFVYVWNPDGYIGKTTSYEIGRIIERKIPIFFKDNPIDLPIYIQKNNVISVENLINYIKNNKSVPNTFEFEDSLTFQLHTKLFNNDYIE